MEKYFKVNVSITAKQREWLILHQEYNVSGLFRRMLDDMMQQEANQ